MKSWTYVCLIIGLLLVVAPAGALVPDNIEILGTSPEWVTAGSNDVATVTVLVSNSSSPVSGVVVDFEVDNSTYGSISDARVETNETGMATAAFKPGTRSGTATITTTVSCEGLAEPLKGSVDLYIDHAAPYAIAGLWYEPEVTAGGTTDITVRMVDQYGNVVDDRREAETVKFTVGSPGGGAAFVGGTDEITVSVDDAGNATVTLQVDRVAGENIVYIQPPKPVRGEYISILGAADGVPAGITCTVNPSSASVPANGKDTMTLMYTLTDAYGNPAGGQGLWVNVSVERVDNPDEHQSSLIYSSSLGEVWVKYGPEESVGVVSITATAAANPDVTSTTQVEFTSTEPVDMLLSASPQTMASRDLKDNIVSMLRAKVMDIKGNPVEGEEVTFEIVPGSVDVGEYTQTEDPELDKTSARTNEDGYAVVPFHPGRFAGPKDGGWDPAAKGTATIRATWGDVSRNIDLTWMNYPYLSVETEVSRANVVVNDPDRNTTDVTIRLKGDGYAMQPDPIDVVLVIDTSGSMSKTDVSPTRMEAAQAAAKDFVDKMSLMTVDGDRVALASFAFDAKMEQGLTRDSDKIKRAVDRLPPDGATNMRMAYYKAIKYLKENGRPEAVKAVILMSDGDWNYHGSPLAKGVGYADNNRYLTSDFYGYPYYAPLSGYRWSGSSYSFSNEGYEWYSALPDPKGDADVPRRMGKGKWYDTMDKMWFWWYNPSSRTCDNGEFTNQNMSVYANSGDDTEKVRIYSIGFASELDSNVEEDLGILSKATGGKYVWAGSEEELKKVYTDIAGELKTEAGVNTTMTVLKNIEVNGAPRSAAGVFDYKHEHGVSTHILNQTGTDVLYDDVIDQTDAWKQDKQLHFDIGTIRLNQIWEATFRLAVKPSYRADDGNNINIFGDGATLSFNNGEETLTLPKTFITVYPNMTNTGITTSPPTVIFTEPQSGSGPYTDAVPLKWQVTYSGTEKVDVSLAYSRYEDMRSPTTFFTKTLPPQRFVTVDNTTTDSTMMDVSDLAPGQYWITVTASTPGVKEGWDTTDVWLHTKGASQAYIKIS